MLEAVVVMVALEPMDVIKQEDLEETARPLVLADRLLQELAAEAELEVTETLLAEALGQVDLEAEALLVVEDLLAEALQDSLTLAVAAVELELDHLHKELLPVQQQEHLEDQVL